ncbi:MAG TPA: hypothetical protein ENK85_05155 [Saprospiraceae bacterium]|nr:hypothetical protein [Saprospiraceae bacterium]
MSTSLRILISATAIIGLLTVTAFQQNSLISYKQLIGVQSQKLKKQAQTIENQAEEIEELTISNTLLEDQLLLVRDSISILQNDLAALKTTLEKSKTNLSAIQKELKVRQKELDFVKAELLQKTSNSAKVAQLKEKVAELEEQLEQLNYLKQNEQEDFVEYETEAQDLETEVVEKEQTAEKMTQLKAILENTIIDYKGISLRTERDGDNISKIKKNGKNWKYTFINFDLQNTNPAFLVGSTFEWRIIDMDNGEPISFIESNQVYPKGIDTKGFSFTYQGYAQEAVFINTQEKQGSSYELKLYYLEDDQAYYVNGSSRPIVFDKHCID